MELNPTIVEVLLFATWLPDEERLALVRSAAFEHPRDGRIFALLADLTNEANERETAFRNALELRPKDVAILKAFVDFLLASHREDDAAPWLKTALERAPNDLRLNELNALFEERTGHCARAIRDYRAAAGLAEDDVSRSVRRRLFMHLAELVATCPADDR
jgi:Tfp pilus assembly protein PilF